MMIVLHVFVNLYHFPVGGILNFTSCFEFYRNLRYCMLILLRRIHSHVAHSYFACVCKLSSVLPSFCEGTYHMHCKNLKYQEEHREVAHI